MIDYTPYVNSPDTIIQALDDDSSKPRLLPNDPTSLPGEYIYEVLTQFSFSTYSFRVWIIPAERKVWCNCEWYQKKPYICQHIASVLWHTEHGCFGDRPAPATDLLPISGLEMPDVLGVVALEAEIALSRDIPINESALSMSQAREIIRYNFARPNPYPARSPLDLADRLIERIEDYLYELEYRA